MCAVVPVGCIGESCLIADLRHPHASLPVHDQRLYEEARPYLSKIASFPRLPVCVYRNDLTAAHTSLHLYRRGLVQTGCTLSSTLASTESPAALCRNVSFGVRLRP